MNMIEYLAFYTVKRILDSMKSLQYNYAPPIQSNVQNINIIVQMSSL